MNTYGWIVARLTSQNITAQRISSTCDVLSCIAPSALFKEYVQSTKIFWDDHRFKHEVVADGRNMWGKNFTTQNYKYFFL